MIARILAPAVLVAALLPTDVRADAELMTITDCDPAPWSLGGVPVQGTPSISASCTNPGIGSATATATYSQLKTAVEAAPTAPTGIGLLASATLKDVITVQPIDASLLGQEGTLRLRARLDGTLTAGAKIYVGGATYTDMGSYILMEQVPAFNSNPSSWIGAAWFTAPSGGLSIDESITFSFPMIYGAPLTYGIGMSVQVTGPNQAAGFLHTAAITGIDAYTREMFFADPNAQLVAATFSTLSGTDIAAEAAFNANAAAVPEPVSAALMLCGLAAVTTFVRRKSILSSAHRAQL